jgi:selenide,water dikinase
VEKYRKLGCIPGGARKNFASYGDKISDMTQEQREILCDAQTSGGLLVIVKKSSLEAFLTVTEASGLVLKQLVRRKQRVNLW